MELMLSDHLKEFTKKAHAALEKRLIAKIKKIQNKADYFKLLMLMYGYYQALEIEINKFIDEQKLPDYTKRRKSELILQDIRGLTSVDGCDIPLCSDIPIIASKEDAFAALYVLEGSTLGGRFIARMIEEQLNCSSSLNFFRGYGEDVILMWNIFKSSLNGLTLNKEQKLQLLSTADAVFLKFENWIIINEEQN